MVLEKVGAPRSSLANSDSCDALMEPIPAMLKKLWTTRPQQQTTVNAAADLSSWPLGQILLRHGVDLHKPQHSCDNIMHDPDQMLKQSQLLQQGYVITRGVLNKESKFQTHRQMMDRGQSNVLPGTGQSQYNSFRPAEWIPRASNYTVACAGVQQDAKQWHAIRLGTFSRQARTTMQNHCEIQQNCRVDTYDIDDSSPKRTILSNIRHGKFGSKMPTKARRETSLVLGTQCDPAPGTYNTTICRRVSRLVTPPEQYQAWRRMLDSSDSARRALIHRQAAVAVGAHIGKDFT